MKTLTIICLLLLTSTAPHPEKQQHKKTETPFRSEILDQWKLLENRVDVKISKAQVKIAEIHYNYNPAK